MTQAVLKTQTLAPEQGSTVESAPKNTGHTELSDILDMIRGMDLAGVRQIQQAAEARLRTADEAQKMAEFERRMREKGLISKFKHPVANPVREHRLVEVQGKPVSETLIEERR